MRDSNTLPQCFIITTDRASDNHASCRPVASGSRQATATGATCVIIIIIITAATTTYGALFVNRHGQRTTTTSHPAEARRRSSLRQFAGGLGVRSATTWEVPDHTSCWWLSTRVAGRAGRRRKRSRCRRRCSSCCCCPSVCRTVTGKRARCELHRWRCNLRRRKCRRLVALWSTHHDSVATQTFGVCS